jgi:hypothetical protein
MGIVALIDEAAVIELWLDDPFPTTTRTGVGGN